MSLHPISNKGIFSIHFCVDSELIKHFILQGQFAPTQTSAELAPYFILLNFPYKSPFSPVIGWFQI